MKQDCILFFFFFFKLLPHVRPSYMRFPDVLKNTCDLFSLQETSYLHVLKKSILVFNNSQTTVGVQMVSVFILLVAYHPISHSSFSNISALKQKEFGDFCIVKIICMCFFFKCYAGLN